MLYQDDYYAEESDYGYDVSTEDQYGKLIE